MMPPTSQNGSPLLEFYLHSYSYGKAFYFFKDSTQLESMMSGSGLDMFANNSQTHSFVITYLTLLGAVFIAVGFITRVMCIIQIPILLGAIIYINGKAGMSFSNTEFILSIIVLILLFLFVVKGSGALSADEFFRSYNKAGEEPGHTKKFFQ
jgi:putative oxidoreductase